MKLGRWGKNLLLLSVGLLVAVAAGEGLSRVLKPVFPGAVRLALDGSQSDVSFMTPGATYRQFSAEYDAITSITAEGYRAPATDDPEVVFVGDSFTFGQGLSDRETFAWRFAEMTDVPVANLGVPGYGTISELDRLESYLREQSWHPRHVFLFVMAMTDFLGSGNDLDDNARHDRRESSDIHATEAPAPPRSRGVLPYQAEILRHSNLARLFKFYFGPALKRLLAPAPDRDRLSLAIRVTGEQFVRFDRLGRDFDFTPHVVLLHPIQDLSRRSDGRTLEALQAVSPIPIVGTASWFAESPGDHYYPLDGHLNADGSRLVAEHLAAFYRSLDSSRAEPSRMKPDTAPRHSSSTR